MGLHAIPWWSLTPEGQVVHVPSIILYWGIFYHDCLDWGQCIDLGCGMKEHHQSRISCAFRVNVSILKRVTGDLYVCFSQNWRTYEWSLAMGRAMPAKLVRPSSFITPLHMGSKATLVVRDFIFVPFPWVMRWSSVQCKMWELGEWTLVLAQTGTFHNSVQSPTSATVSIPSVHLSWLACKVPPGWGHHPDRGIGLFPSSNSEVRWVSKPLWRSLGLLISQRVEVWIGIWYYSTWSRENGGVSLL